jgi:entericidin B
MSFFILQGVVMRMLTVMVALTIVFGLSACHTIQGVGKDVQSGGEALEKTGK